MLMKEFKSAHSKMFSKLRNNNSAENANGHNSKSSQTQATDKTQTDEANSANQIVVRPRAGIAS